MKLWLQITCVFIFLTLAVGGITRLTGSGLSIVDWRPITGTVPPLSSEAWQVEFAKYQTSPQFQKVNSHFGITEFKEIYFWEYLHRLLGRLTGLVFIIPFIFYFRKTDIKVKASLVLALFQGVIGWYMVKSGLSDEPRVSHVRLAIHFGNAALIYILLLSASKQNKIPHIIWLIFIQMILGALVAGHGNYLSIHQHFAYLVAAATIYYAIKKQHYLPILFVVGQVALGFATLYYGSPVLLASMHQINAMLLITTILLKKPKTSL
jgi:heme A synthase